ncbi:hypothetical protein HBH98_242620 [Parastagonospora nodorum]|nr:hypothetical protein HBI10_214010 [Parastagonospora nodorum]KAH4043905.1 hypothetical protein HBH49_228110 [Parastagonospora nodorum]KAH4115375.1 hypothetical protein HBH47_180270 [Parastagonospora nodorum]KAH4183020.1 hypothetical protein HBH42_208660 [Parastagonospora nodorum]KAH4288195.1 hypothetical protein HBI02_213070 [Parastagonospora nodorum]
MYAIAVDSRSTNFNISNPNRTNVDIASMSKTPKPTAGNSTQSTHTGATDEATERDVRTV